MAEIARLSRPAMIFDGDCGFCRRWIAYWKILTGDEVEYFPYQEVESRFPQIPRERYMESVQYVEPSGRVSKGAHAVFRALATRPSLRWMLRAYERVPGVSAVTEWLYRRVARNRVAFSWLTYFLWGEKVRPSTSVLTRWLFLRGLGIVYLVAFLSLGSQIGGLVGSQGIVPAEMSDSSIKALCAAGASLSGLLVAGVAPLPVTALLWVLYWKLMDVTGPFLWFQWDSLMLEMGLLGVFLSPRSLLPRRMVGLTEERPPSLIAIWLLRWLVFRFMFGSGIVKLRSGDPHWRDLSALQFHFETQPLPTWVGWYIHQLPAWALQAACALMFFVELGLPFLVFLPRRPRILAFFAFVGLQLFIDLAGNYGFFGLQTIVISLVLLDDEFLSRILPRKVRSRFLDRAAEARGRTLGIAGWARGTATAAFAAVVLGVTLFHSTDLQREIEPLRSINSYGVFAVMTTERPEIVIEGSADGTTWLPYEFKWKPGDLQRMPAFVEPHMPRLDWQMWFAALGSRESNPWFDHLMFRLLQGAPPVLELFQANPFPAAPPKYLRAQLYRYRFTDSAARQASGAWWTREYLGPYSPVVSLKTAGL